MVAGRTLSYSPERLRFPGGLFPPAGYEGLFLELIGSDDMVVELRRTPSTGLVVVSAQLDNGCELLCV